MIIIDPKKCFECGNTATEQHHIIPQVYGGKRTLPLCSECHMKVHGIFSKRRVDNHIENTKRGLDKRRIWELFSGYYITSNNKDIVLSEFKTLHLSTFKKKFFSEIKYKLIFSRLNEIEKNYLFELFDNEINNFFSWRKINHNSIKEVEKIIIDNLERYGNKLGNPQNLTRKAIENSINKRTKLSLEDSNNIEMATIIIEEFKKGLNFSQITKLLAEKGYKSRWGKEISQVQVKRLYLRFLDKS